MTPCGNAEGFLEEKGGRQTVRRALVSVLSLALFLNLTPVAYAQATRTWVAASGDDADPCSRTAPCATFAGTLSKTANGGFISVADSDGYGSVTITKSVTIDGEGAQAAVLSSGVSGIIINAPGKRVVLRNLSIDSPTPASPGGMPFIGNWGIIVLAAAEVHIENVVINGFGTGAIEFNPAGGAEGYFNNVSLLNNSGFGILVKQGRVTATGLHASSNPQALYVYGMAIATVRDCYAGGGGQGFRAGLAGAILNIDNCTMTHNRAGIWADAGATVRVSNSMIISNTGAGLGNNGGTFVSLGGNTLTAICRMVLSTRRLRNSKLSTMRQRRSAM